MNGKIVGQAMPSTNSYTDATFFYVDLIKLVLVRHGFTQDVLGLFGLSITGVAIATAAK